jgi:hypothetical protein
MGIVRTLMENQRMDSEGKAAAMCFKELLRNWFADFEVRWRIQTGQRNPD